MCKNCMVGRHKIHLALAIAGTRTQGTLNCAAYIIQGSSHLTDDESEGWRIPVWFRTTTFTSWSHIQNSSLYGFTRKLRGCCHLKRGSAHFRASVITTLQEIDKSKIRVTASSCQLSSWVTGSNDWVSPAGAGDIIVWGNDIVRIYQSTITQTLSHR